MNSEETLNFARRKYPNDENLRVAYMLGFNDGADRKEELMMKEALDAEVYRYMDPYKKNWTAFLVDVPFEKFKEKAKIIVINEDNTI